MIFIIIVGVITPVKNHFTVLLENNRKQKPALFPLRFKPEGPAYKKLPFQQFRVIRKYGDKTGLNRHCFYSYFFQKVALIPGSTGPFQE